MPRALIAMSGGVDSAVAAYLMQQAGFDCIGATMRLHTADGCGSGADVEDARRIAERLGMAHYVFDFCDDFRREVIDRFVDAYERGQTPNPCIDCNRYLKFDRLYREAEALGCDCIVTGHYARIEQENGRFTLKKALDDTKDQSYVLYSLTQEQLTHTRFPLGVLTKTQVRAIAEEQGFVNAHKKDSQDICFVPDGDYAAAITRLTGKTYPAGDFVDSEGRVLGRHRGIIHYTVGQRKGLGLGLALPAPLYVAEKRTADNAVVLVPNEALFSRRLAAVRVNWTSGETPTQPLRASARIRYKHTEQPATVTPQGDGFVLCFDEPQRAITPGQAVVLYSGDTVIGGGTIV